MKLREAAQRVLAEYDNDSVGFKLFGALEDLRAALAEPQSTHSADCWKWHHQCAIAKIERECEHD